MNLLETDVIDGVSTIEFFLYFAALCHSLYLIKRPYVSSKWLRLGLIFGFWVVASITLFFRQPMEAWFFRFVMILAVVSEYVFGGEEAVGRVTKTKS